MHVVGLMLHPERDCGGAVASVLDWADQRGIQVLGIDTELSRLACSASPVSREEMRERADLLVSMGGDGTVLRALRLADGQRFPVLGVNLGKLGFLAEVDVPDLPDALSAIDAHSYTTEPRLAVDAAIGDRVVTAFNDVAFVRFPGHKTAAVAVCAGGHPFVSYAADAIVVATPTGSTAYSFSAGGPIVSPAVECLVVTPVAPHSAYNRGLVLSPGDQLSLHILPGSGGLAVEADGIAAMDVGPGDQIELRPRPGAARVVRLGRTTFYQRTRRKLRLTDSAEIAATFGDGWSSMPPSSETYLHGHHDSVLRSHRWRTAENSAGYLLPRLAPGAYVLDVGCGPGTITVDLAARVPDGQVTGIDAAAGVVSVARQEADRRGQANVRFETGDVYQLAFADATFDVVHAHQVLQHLSDPVAALGEMRRVCRPGGLVAVRDGDYGGMFWFPDDPELAEWQALYRSVARALGGEPDAGRCLLSWTRSAGFDEITASASAWCYTGPDDRPWWGTLWARRLTESPFGDRAVEHGLATRADLERLARAWLRFADSEDGWFLIPHGEILGTA